MSWLDTTLSVGNRRSEVSDDALDVSTNRFQYAMVMTSLNVCHGKRLIHDTYATFSSISTTRPCLNPPEISRLRIDDKKKSTDLSFVEFQF